MPSNLYESKNEFRLYDVEGVILSPNEYILINEPEGFRDFNITIERDPDKHGLFYEFGGDDELLGFDRVTLSGQSYSPYEFINTILDSKGIDSKIQLEFLSDDISQYKADFDFESLNIEDYKISVNVRRVLLGDLFRTRIETPVDFSGTTSIDGESITGLSPDSMFLHGKAINSSFFCNDRQTDSSDFIPVTSSTTPNNGNPVYSNIGYVNITDNSIKTYNNTGLGLTSVPVPLFTLNEGGVFLINELQINKLISCGFGGSTNWGLYYRVGENDEILFASATGGRQSGGFVDADFEYSITNFTIDIPVTDIRGSIDVYIYIKIECSGSGGDITLEDGVKDNVGVFKLKEDFLDITLEGLRDSSFCDVYPVFESTNHIIESITNQVNVLESSYLSSVNFTMYQTNGYSIRKFIGSDSNVSSTVKSSFKDQFDKFLHNNFGLGYAIYENNGQFKILIERYEEFYQDNEIEYIDNIQDTTYFVEYDKELIYNEVKIGYKDFPKSTDENKSNNLDEFNTEHNYLTPIESVKNKKEYISEAIASGYKIENQRREQFKDVPSDTVSDDDKMFVINGVISNIYKDVLVSFDSSGSNQITIFATYLDINIGDSLSFTNATSTGSFFVSTLQKTGNKIIITVTGSFTVEIVTTDILRNNNRLRALRDEEFQVVQNVISPKTCYNIGLNPKYMLKNHSLIINSGFNPKSDTEQIKPVLIKLNEELECKFLANEGSYNVDSNTTVKMNENMFLSNYNNYQKLFTGFLIKFTANINYQRLLSIRNDYLNQGSNNFGYIRIKTPLGTEKKGFLMSMNYNPLSEQAEFVLREKFE